MSELKMGIGESDEWYTPPEIFDAIGMTFDLDPCAPMQIKTVPAYRHFTKLEDGLSQEWTGTVFMNPPFGGRNGHVPWLQKFFDHGDGIALARAYTSAGWFHQFAPRASGLLFPKGKTKFIRADGTIGGSPSSGIALFACGPKAHTALMQSDLGLFYESRSP